MISDFMTEKLRFSVFTVYNSNMTGNITYNSEKEFYVTLCVAIIIYFKYLFILHYAIDDGNLFII